MIRYYKKDQEWIIGKEADLIYVDATEAPAGYTADVFELLPANHPKSKRVAEDLEVTPAKKRVSRSTKRGR